jgi:hypothetical protein
MPATPERKTLKRAKSLQQTMKRLSALGNAVAIERQSERNSNGPQTAWSMYSFSLERLYAEDTAEFEPWAWSQRELQIEAGLIARRTNVHKAPLVTTASGVLSYSTPASVPRGRKEDVYSNGLYLRTAKT